MAGKYGGSRHHSTTRFNVLDLETSHEMLELFAIEGGLNLRH